jgi:hypothetical protein
MCTKVLQYTILSKTTIRYIQNNFLLNCTREAVFDELKKAHTQKGSISWSLHRFQNSTIPAQDSTRRLGDQGNISSYDPLEKKFNILHLLIPKPETFAPLPSFTPNCSTSSSALTMPVICLTSITKVSVLWLIFHPGWALSYLFCNCYKR